MQIHELTQSQKPRLDEIFGINTVGDAIKSGGDTLKWGNTGRQARQDAEQGRINTQAAGAIAKLTKQGYTGEAPTLDQALAKFKANTAAQQWVNSMVAKWPAQAQQMAKTKSAVTTVKEEESVYLPGSKKPLDPNNPKDAQVLAAMSKQGLTPAIATKPISQLPRKKSQNNTAPQTPSTPTYADQFRQWVDQELKTIKLADIEQSIPELVPRLNKIMNDIVKNQNNLLAQKKLVHDFFSLAVAANHVVTAQSRLGQYRGTSPVIPSNSSQDIALDAIQQLALTQKLRTAGVTRAKSTRVPALDKLLQTLGVQITP